MIKYKVDEEKRTVVAYFDNTTKDQLMDVFKEIDGVFSDYNYSVRKDGIHIDVFISGGVTRVKKVMKGFEKFVGVAKCHPDDEFDVEKGKLVARERLLHKQRKYKDIVIMLLLKDLDGAYATIKRNLAKKIYRKHELLED